MSKSKVAPSKTKQKEVLVTEENCADLIGKLVLLTDIGTQSVAKQQSRKKAAVAGNLIDNR